MHLRHFGDSFDIVKQSVLRWLAPFAPWAVHPMFTSAVSADELSQFELFLGSRIISDRVLTPETDRVAYFAPCEGVFNLLLDPTTGIRYEPVPARRRPEYLFAHELQHLVGLRASTLTVVFDQSVPRGRERSAIAAKLRQFASSGVHAFAYVSHACFIVASNDKLLAEGARQLLLNDSRLPVARLTSVGAV